MARTYLEALEQASPDPEFVRIDVTSKTEQERADILAKLKDLETGVTCVFSKHTCHHEEGGQSCESEVV